MADSTENSWVGTVAAAITNALKASADETVKENAAFASESGLSAKIVRKTSGETCAWCRDKAGTYDYGSEPSDVYRRHDNCDCTVEYVVGKDRQNVHTKTWTRSEEADKIELRKGIGLKAKGINANIKLDDITVHKSVGAKSLNYDVMDLASGEMFQFAEGTKIQNVEVFAGKGVKERYNNAWKYAEKYGGRAEDWQHVKGFGWIRTDDGDRHAEVHWSQCEGIGKVDFFVKEWLD